MVVDHRPFGIGDRCTGSQLVRKLRRQRLDQRRQPQLKCSSAGRSGAWCIHGEPCRAGRRRGAEPRVTLLASNRSPVITLNRGILWEISPRRLRSCARRHHRACRAQHPPSNRVSVLPVTTWFPRVPAPRCHHQLLLRRYRSSALRPFEQLSPACRRWPVPHPAVFSGRRRMKSAVPACSAFCGIGAGRRVSINHIAACSASACSISWFPCTAPRPPNRPPARRLR